MLHAELKPSKITFQMSNSKFLLKIDLSDLLAIDSCDCIYTLMIDPTEFTLICEVKQWIRLLFNLRYEINLKYNGGIIHDFESVSVITLLIGTVSVVKCAANLNSGVHTPYKDYNWLRGQPVFSSVQQKLEKIFPTIRNFSENLLTETVPSVLGQENDHINIQERAQSGTAKQSRRRQDSLDSIIENLRNESHSKIIDQKQEGSKSGISFESRRNQSSLGALLKNLRNDSHSTVIDQDEEVDKQRGAESCTTIESRRHQSSLGALLRNLRNESHSAVTEDQEEVAQVHEVKRKRVRKHRKRRQGQNDSTIEICPEPTLQSSPICSSVTPKHVRFSASDDDDQSCNMTENTPEPLQTSVEVEPSSLFTFDLAPKALPFALKNMGDVPPVFVRAQSSLVE